MRGALFRGETFRNAFSSLVSKVQNRVFKNPPLNMIMGYFDPFDIIDAMFVCNMALVNGTPSSYLGLTIHNNKA